MKKGALAILIVTGLLKVPLCVLSQFTVIFVSSEKTWSEARAYCRDTYTDLLSINSLEEENLTLGFMVEQQITKTWIGLYKDSSDTWMWSGGRNASFFNWVTKDRGNGKHKCVTRVKKGWFPTNCDREFGFLCLKSGATLVKENKTWEEAVGRCRQEGADLVSLPSEAALVAALQTGRAAQGERVWIGLRYLADGWLWVDGEAMERQAWIMGGEMPQCPASGHRCGALSLVEHHWDSWDCTDKLNFVCH